MQRNGVALCKFSVLVGVEILYRYVLCGLSRLKEEGLSDSSAKTLSRSNRLGTV